jgi:hypothetical protein
MGPMCRCGRRRFPAPCRFGEVVPRNIAPDCVWDRRPRNLAAGPGQYRLPAKIREARHLRSAGALGHECIADIVVPVGYCAAVSLTMNSHAVAPGTGKGAAGKNPPWCPERLRLTPRQRAAIAAFSVALGRIAADALAGSGR